MPISDAFAWTVAALVLLGILVGSRVMWLRNTEKVGIGHGDNRTLRRAIRAHGNFAEWVPLALLTLGVAELRGASDTWMWWLGGLLLAGRLLHAFGLSRNAGPSVGRSGGVTLTLVSMVLAAVLAVLGG